MGGQWNDELQRRQQAGDVGFLGTPGRKLLRRKALLLPLSVALVGLVVIYATPFRGLGVVLFFGGLAAGVMMSNSRWLGR